ncbi:protein-glutamine gamma-glutamyltransferase K-like [Aplochiton taeniatus]
MPVESRSIRNRSAVGRFPSVSLVWDSETGDEKEFLQDQPDEGACRRWLRKICPCCCPKKSGPGPNTDTVIIGTDDGGKDKGTDGNKPDSAGSELDELLLKVRSVNLMKTKTDQNRKEHHTDCYHGNDLIIRRGQTFQMWLDLSRPFDQNTDKLYLELKTGLLPTISKNTHVIVPLVEELSDDRWEAKIVQRDGNKIKLSVNSLPTTVIGRYQLTVATHTVKGDYTSTHDPANDIYILFNPWCEDDTVYMDDEKELEEYVLNDVGRLYYGTENQIGSRTWNYGQFDEGLLAACLYVLEKSLTPPSGWGDAVNVVRVISAMINSVDDNGVITGNWSGNYIDGTPPTSWSGSVDILKKYHQEGGTPVKYGQCWVFSGVTTTVLRCLGIPSRSVTNFSSAHDTDVSLTVDVYMDENMEPLEHLNRDSIWNFHVWNDCWMSRPDLPAGMGGWQAVDSTPQETSLGTFCCGPASVAAIRNGQVFLKHDCPFVFAEVNSDKIYWQKNLDGTFSQIYCEKNVVGHHISTKAVGSEERNDITNLYKYPEGSEQERIAVETACRYGSKPQVYASPKAEDVSLEVTMDGEGPRMGADAELNIILRNSSSVPRTIRLNSQVAVMYYTGVLKGIVKKDNVEVELLPNEVQTMVWTLEHKHYQDQLVDQAALMLTLSGRVDQTQQVLATQFSFRLRTPDLIIKPIGDAVVGKKMAAEISFTNPLPRMLKGVVFRLEGLGLLRVRKVTVGDIGSYASVKLTENFIPTLAGSRKLVALLDCRQLTQVHGVATIDVLEK